MFDLFSVDDLSLKTMTQIPLSSSIHAPQRRLVSLEAFQSSLSSCSLFEFCSACRFVFVGSVILASCAFFNYSQRPSARIVLLC